MALEQALTYVVALAVPVWLVVEQLLVRQRREKERQVQVVPATRDKAGLSPAVLLSELPQKAA